MRQAAASASSATPVECSRSHGDLRPVSAAMAMKAASTRSPAIQICGNGSISSACSHIRVSSSSARRSSKFAQRRARRAEARTRRPLDARRPPVPRRGPRRRGRGRCPSPRAGDASATGSRRRGRPGIPVRPSARRRTRAPPGCSSRGRATRRTAAPPRTSSRTRHGPSEPALAMASSIIAARTSGARPAPTWAR